MKQTRKLDRDFLDRSLLAVDVDELGSVVVAESVVEILRRSGLSDVEEDVVEDDLLVVSGRGLEISLEVKSLSSFPVEEPAKKTRRSARASRRREIERWDSLFHQVRPTWRRSLQFPRIHSSFNLEEAVIEAL